MDTPALTPTPSAIRPRLHASQLPGPPLVALYFLDLVRLLIFYWAIAADALLLKVRSARRPRACRMGAGREGGSSGHGAAAEPLGGGCPLARQQAQRQQQAVGSKAAAGRPR